MPHDFDYLTLLNCLHFKQWLVSTSMNKQKCIHYTKLLVSIRRSTPQAGPAAYSLVFTEYWVSNFFSPCSLTCLPISTLHTLPETGLVWLSTRTIEHNHFCIRSPNMPSSTETIQQHKTCIKTQKVPGHRLCKSALFSEAESIKTAD